MFVRLENMNNRPKWNYWHFEDLGDGRFLPVDYDGYLSKGDIRKDEYSLDTKKWCSKFYWTAEQAALISFALDPDRVLNSEDLLPFDADEFDEHVRLCKHINDLMVLISDAQDRGAILRPRFLPGMYVEWATDAGVDFPPFVKSALDAIEAERKTRLTMEPPQQSNDISNEEPKSGVFSGIKSQQVRKENNLRKVIRALLIRSNLHKNPDPAPLSRKLEEILEAEATEQSEKNFRLSAGKIRKILEQATTLYE